MMSIAPNNEKHIWIIDDDIGILEVTQMLLEEEGFKTTLIQNEQDLKQNITSGNIPHVILLDILMSGIDGRDIAISLKKDVVMKNIPIIMMSADTKIEEKAQAAGANDFVKKPFDIDDLLKTINKWLLKGK